MSLFMFLALIFACGSSQAPSEASTTNVKSGTPAASPEQPGVDQAALAEVLKKADMADGTEDQVAHKCAGCALAMDGSAEHAIEVEGTTLHLCSSMCKTNFSKDTTGNLMKLMN